MDSVTKKLKRAAVLAAFTALWGGCTDDVTEAPALYGCGPCGCGNDECEHSSSSEQATSSETQELEKSSSSLEIVDGPVLQESSSSIDNNSSDSIEEPSEIVDMPMALYGPPCIFNNSCDTEFVEPEEKIEPENE